MEQSEEPENNVGAKRKSEDGHGQQRAKRNRYISIACNECKRRKIKCNGMQPCQRCGNLSLECVYAPNCCGTNFKDSEDWRQMTAHISSLQEQVNALFASVSNFRSELTNSNPPLDPTLPPPSYRPEMSLAQHSHLLNPERVATRTPPITRAPTFRGPTSNAFSFDVAKSSLHTMGIAPEAQTNDDENGTANGSPVLSPRLPALEYTTSQQKDPIWFITQSEALRLVSLYDREVHQMYPIISIEQTKTHIHGLFRFLDAFRGSMLKKHAPGADAIYDDDTITLKLILAVSLASEGKGRSETGQRLYETVQPHIHGLLMGNAGPKAIRQLALTAMYEFHIDNEGTAWRIIGLAARMCMECGLHRKETYDAMSPENLESTVLLFWAIYTLDRRWSFGTGMPFALQDSDLDPQLPRPNEKAPYLTSMIDYCMLGSKVWQAIGADDNNSSGQSSITRENLKYLDYLVRQWHQNLPDQLRFDHLTLDQLSDPTVSMASSRLKVILYLRRNNMLINIYRPVLYSATNIMQHHPQAQEVVNIAQDTVQTMTRLNRASDMYQSSQVVFNAFLTSALAVLFLAVSHAPAAFSAQVRDEVHQALSLVRGFSRGSFVSKRLWKTIKVLKEVGPKLGLATDETNHQQHQHQRSQDDGSRSAALAMAGLASGAHSARDFMLAKPYPATPSTAMSTLASPDNMANDLTRLFEAAGNTEQELHMPAFSVDSAEIGFGSEDELGRIMRDLF